MKWERIKKIIPFIGIGLFIYLLIFKVGILKIFQEIQNVNLFYVFIALGITAFFWITQTLKWFVIAKKQKIVIPFKDALKINFISNFYGFITPSKIGSIIRVDYLKDYQRDTGKGLSNFFMDKVLDLSSLFILTIIFAFVFYKQIISLTYLYIIIGIFILMISLSLFFYKKEASKPFLRFIYCRIIPKRIKEKSRLLFSSFYEDIPTLPFLLLILIINLFNWVIGYAGMYFMGLALGINLGFIPFLAILPIATLVAQLPITIDGLGTRELTMISLFGLFGIEAVKVFSMSILNIVLINVIPSFFAIILIFIRRKNKINN